MGRGVQGTGPAEAVLPEPGRHPQPRAVQRGAGVRVGLDEEAWRARSVEIRRDHECTHYFTLRAFGVIRNNLLDEFVAEFAGLAGAFGRYDASLFLRFLGLEAHPAYRSGGRFENYLQASPLPAEAVPILRSIVVQAARRLERAAADAELPLLGVRTRFVVALRGTTLVALASDGGAARLQDRLDTLRLA